MHLKPAVAGVPTQAQEVVSPGLAAHHDGRQQEIEGLGAAKSRAEQRAPVNRLIWTNDNLVALKPGWGSAALPLLASSAPLRGDAGLSP
jgi:hypothetical protein